MPSFHTASRFCAMNLGTAPVYGLRGVRWAAVTMLFTALLLAGCGNPVPEDITLYEGPDPTHLQPPGRDEVEVQFLGVAGFLFRHAGVSLMTAPMFSNPPWWKVIPFTVLRTDREAVARWIPPVADVQAILVGHAHYDHLMDVPWIMRRHARSAVAYGSRTMTHIVAAEVPRRRLKAVNVLAAHGATAGVWLYNPQRTARWMALRSRHAPHFSGVTLLGGSYGEDLQRLPRTFAGYVEGETFAWLIDFLDDLGRARFRIYYQDSAASPPDGVIPELAEADRRPVDVAVIGVASFAQLDNHPEGIIGHTAARHYVFSHWENFTRGLDEAPEPLPGTDLGLFVRRAVAALPEGAAWYLPKPMAVLRIPVPD